MTTSRNTIERLQVVTPVFNDWTSSRVLLLALDAVARNLSCDVAVSAVDDGSSQDDAEIYECISQLRHLSRVEVIRLSVNVGHQRAIAIGLCIASEEAWCNGALVMDADGEDPPETIPLLLAEAAGKTDFCVVATRRKRSETRSFKVAYLLYKSIFTLLTGKHISFGNFSLLSIKNIRNLTMVPDLWNNLPAAILRSRMPITKISIDRGKRYAGQSKMNFTSLIVHGLSAISVYADTIFVRLILTTLGLVVLTVFVIGATFLLRVLVPAHATPGWATTVSFGMIIILLQVLFTTLISILMLLNNRVQRLILPAIDYKPYVRTREVLFENPSKQAP